nr:EGF-like, conserved site-containing protein [Tanacetum cinerariifolium]
MVKRKTQIEPKIEKEAWKFHCWSIVDYCVTLFGTLTTTNPTNKLSLNYDQVFLRDFTSESSIVGAHTLGQTAEWFKSALAFERIRGNLSLSGYFACGQLPRAHVEGAHTFGQTAEWFKSALSFERIRGNLSLSDYFACGQDGGVQLPRAYIEGMLVELQEHVEPIDMANVEFFVSSF